jgi:hypothetical protein
MRIQVVVKVSNMSQVGMNAMMRRIEYEAESALSAKCGDLFKRLHWFPSASRGV